MKEQEHNPIFSCTLDICHLGLRRFFHHLKYEGIAVLVAQFPVVSRKNQISTLPIIVLRFLMYEVFYDNRYSCAYPTLKIFNFIRSEIIERTWFKFQNFLKILMCIFRRNLYP